ncbi:MAG: hypothetical protein EXS10_07665 [Phycisphaerales bacterium]|nr:hypothetical protein [Phycisphaerales bacterium]
MLHAMSTIMPTTMPLLLADAPVLMSIAKPILMFAALVAYMRYIAKFEFDARFYNFPLLAINASFVAIGVLGFAVVLLIPIFWIGFPLMLAIYAGTLLGYWKFRDARVPENRKFVLLGSKLQNAMEARRTRSSERAASAFFLSLTGVKMPVPAKEDPKLAVYIAAEGATIEAFNRRASRVDIAANAQAVQVTMLIDGLRVRMDPMPVDVGHQMIDFLKTAAGLDVADRRRRQVGECNVENTGGKQRLTLTTLGSAQGHSLRIDFNRAKSVERPLDDLGLLPAQITALRTLEDVALRHGVFIVSAPIGQGASTTGYAFLGRHDAYTCNLKTLEKEVLHRLEGVEHVQWDANDPAHDFPEKLRSILRKDPDAVLCTDVSDVGAAKQAATPGMKGPLVYVIIPSDSVQSAYAKWVELVGDAKLAAKCITGISNQRLLRNVCPNCKVGFQPSPEQSKRLGIPPGKTVELFRQSGKIQVKNKIEECPVCQGTGFFSQSAIFEVLLIDDAGRAALAEGDFRGAYARAIREQKMLQLQEAALHKVRDGKTSFDEAARAFAKPAPASAAAKPAAVAGTAPPSGAKP